MNETQQSSTNRTPICATREQIPLLEEGGIDAFLRTREVLPYAPDAWYVPDSVKIGYEVSFTVSLLLQTPADCYALLEEIRADILALERDGNGGVAGGDCGRPSR